MNGLDDRSSPSHADDADNIDYRIWVKSCYSCKDELLTVRVRREGDDAEK